MRNEKIDWEFLRKVLNNIASYIEKTKKKPGKRKYFLKKTRDLKLKLENHRCEDCGRYNEHLEFNHKNCDRTNNHITNCELLCPNCHAKKHRKKI